MIGFLFLSFVSGQCMVNNTPATLFTTTPASVLQWARWLPTTVLDMGVYQSNVSAYLFGACAMRNATLCLTPSLSVADSLFAAAYVALPTHTAAANNTGEYADYVLSYRFTYKDSGFLTEQAFGMSHYVGLDGGVGLVDTPNLPSMAFYSGGLAQNFGIANTDTYWPTLVIGRLQPETYWCADFVLLGTNTTPPCRYVTDARYTAGVRNGTYNATVVFRFANGTLWVRSAQTTYANGSTLLADPAPLPAWSATSLTHAPRRLFIMSVLSVLEIDSLSLTYTLCQATAAAAAAAATTTKATTTKSFTSTMPTTRLTTTKTSMQPASSSTIAPTLSLSSTSTSLRFTTTTSSTTTTSTIAATSLSASTTTTTMSTMPTTSSLPASFSTRVLPTSLLILQSSSSSRSSTLMPTEMTTTTRQETVTNVIIVMPTRVSSAPNETKLIATIALTTALIVCCFVACVAARKRVRASRAWIALYRCMPAPLQHACCTKTRIADNDDSEANDDERLAERVMRAPDIDAHSMAPSPAAAAKRANTDVSAITIPVVAKTMQLPAPLVMPMSLANEYTAIPIMNAEPNTTVSLPPPPMSATRQPAHAYDRVRTKQVAGAIHYDRVSAVGKLPGEYDQVESPLN